MSAVSEWQTCASYFCMLPAMPDTYWVLLLPVGIVALIGVLFLPIRNDADRKPVPLLRVLARSLGGRWQMRLLPENSNELRNWCAAFSVLLFLFALVRVVFPFGIFLEAPPAAAALHLAGGVIGLVAAFVFLRTGKASAGWALLVGAVLQMAGILWQ